MKTGVEAGATSARVESEADLRLRDEMEIGAMAHEVENSRSSNTIDGRRWLNTSEIARWLGLPVRAIQRLTSSKRIPHVKLGHRTILFDRHVVDEWLEAQVAVSAADAIAHLDSDPRRGELILDALARRRARSGS